VEPASEEENENLLNEVQWIRLLRECKGWFRSLPYSKRENKNNKCSFGGES